MKRIEKLVVAFMVAAILKSVCNYLSIHWYNRWISQNIMSSVESGEFIRTWISFMTPLIPGIVCAVWLSFEARTEKLTRWVWSLFGLFFRLEAVIIFYAYSIVKHMKKE